MVFSVDHESKKVIATIYDGGIEQYECNISGCRNPVCTCRSIYLELIPMPIMKEDESRICRRVNIDIEGKTLINEGAFITPKEDLDFANSFLKALTDIDYTFLNKMHLEFKNTITEEVDAASIDASFDYTDVERDRLMLAYNDVLPYGDQILVTIEGNNYIVLDQFCLLPKCSCTDTTLSIMPVDRVYNEAQELCSISVNYRKKQWKDFLEIQSSSLSADKLKSAMEIQVPDFYDKLLKRHIRLKSIYAHCKKRHFESQQLLNTSRVGRNDPCPCGSGKKYKKCCLVKTN